MKKKEIDRYASRKKKRPEMETTEHQRDSRN